METERYVVCQCSYSEIQRLIETKHYLKRRPQVTDSFALYDRETRNIVGALTIGKPASNSQCVGVCGAEAKKYVYELNRLYVEDGVDFPESKFISASISLFQRTFGNAILVSYADTDMGHVGAIYQASNWLYTGKTPSRTDKFVPEGKHSRHYDKDQDNSVRVVRSSKHRYVMFVGTKGFKKWCMARLQYKEADYPKGDLSYYDEDFKYKKKLVFREA